MRVMPREIVQVQEKGVFVRTEVEVSAEDVGHAIVEESARSDLHKHKVMMLFFGMASELERQFPNHADRRRWMGAIRDRLSEECIELLDGILNPPAREG